MNEKSSVVCMTIMFLNILTALRYTESCCKKVKQTCIKPEIENTTQKQVVIYRARAKFHILLDKV